jgi:pyruvate formate lyase activating enzyme
MRGVAGERRVGQQFTSAELAARLNSQAKLLRLGRGGVTFSGGEPLMQAPFLAETIDQLRDSHVTLDTCGNATEHDFRAVASRCDFVLFDLKLADPEAHRQWTGIDNATILRNLTRLCTLGTPFIIRVPMVPGVTDTDDNLSGIAGIVSGLPRRVPVELLPYNRGARGKYAACGMEWKPGFDDSAEPHPNLQHFSNLNVEALLA